MNPRALRAAAALAAAMGLWLGASSGASGHALLLESLPRPDETVPPSFSRVVLRFNSRIEKSLSRAAVSVANGRRVPLRATTDGKPDQLVVEFAPLPPGRYGLEWQVLSADGHLTRGSFPFRIAPGP